jgi:hypothetical protein
VQKWCNISGKINRLEHLDKSFIGCRNMIDKGLVLVPENKSMD